MESKCCVDLDNGGSKRFSSQMEIFTLFPLLANSHLTNKSRSNGLILPGRRNHSLLCPLQHQAHASLTVCVTLCYYPVSLSISTPLCKGGRNLRAGMIFRQVCISRANTGPGSMMVGGGEACWLTSYQVLGHLAFYFVLLIVLLGGCLFYTGAN